MAGLSLRDSGYLMFIVLDVFRMPVNLTPRVAEKGANTSLLLDWKE